MAHTLNIVAVNGSPSRPSRTLVLLLALIDRPVLLAATGGSARHPLAAVAVAAGA